jgi:hypothetical protein
MSVKSQLTQAIAELPDSLSMEEAVERIYRAFKLKQERVGSKTALSSDGTLRNLVGLLGTPPRSLTLDEMDVALQDRFRGEADDRG